MTNTSTELDMLMSLDPLEMTREDIDAIISYQRNARAQREAGVKAKPTKESGPKVKISLESLGLRVAAPTAAPMKRRV